MLRMICIATFAEMVSFLMKTPSVACNVSTCLYIVFRFIFYKLIIIIILHSLAFPTAGHKPPSVPSNTVLSIYNPRFVWQYHLNYIFYTESGIIIYGGEVLTIGSQSPTRCCEIEPIEPGNTCGATGMPSPMLTRLLLKT